MLLDEINLAPQDSTPRKTAVELAIHSTMTGSNLTTWSMQHGIYIYNIYSDPKADRLFLEGEDLRWNYVGCWPLKKVVVGIFRPPPGRSKSGSWNMVWRVR